MSGGVRESLGIPFLLLGVSFGGRSGAPGPRTAPLSKRGGLSGLVVGETAVLDRRVYSTPQLPRSIITDRPPYSPDIVPRDLHLLRVLEIGIRSRGKFAVRRPGPASRRSFFSRRTPTNAAAISRFRFDVAARCAILSSLPTRTVYERLVDAI